VSTIRNHRRLEPGGGTAYWTNWCDLFNEKQKVAVFAAEPIVDIIEQMVGRRIMRVRRIKVEPLPAPTTVS